MNAAGAGDNGLSRAGASRRVGQAAALAGSALLAGQVLPAATWLSGVRRLTGLAGIGRAGHAALTFDDGPHPQATPAVLAVLAELGWQATFFMLGESAVHYPELAAAVAAGGHEIALHGYAHRRLLTRGPGAIAADLDAGLGALVATTGELPRWWRPTYGVATGPAILAARRRGLTPILWSAWGRDWTPRATGPRVTAQLLRGRLDAGTLLLHDAPGPRAPEAWRATVAALPLLAERVGSLGLDVGPLREHFAAGARGTAGSRREP